MERTAWVAVGDSFKFGIGVDQKATWEAQLAHLAQREIVNLGVQRHGPEQYNILKNILKHERSSESHCTLKWFSNCLFTNARQG